ncbi:MAG: 50S ribosomal protein L1 [Elusimicrobiota bacterium]
MAGKKFREVQKLIDPEKLYTVEAAVELLKKTAVTKFDSTVEIHIALGIDPKQSDQLVRGTTVLPAGTGKTKRVAVIAKGEKVKEAEAAGADTVGEDDLVEKISKGWMEFDVLVATPDMMKNASRLGKLLGSRGLMPNPKAGTVTFELEKTVKELKAGRIEYRVDSYGIVHLPIGKASFDKDKLLLNVNAIIGAITQARPAAAKGQYIKSITLTTTMGPAIHVEALQKVAA